MFYYSYGEHLPNEIEEMITTSSRKLGVNWDIHFDYIPITTDVMPIEDTPLILSVLSHQKKRDHIITVNETKLGNLLFNGASIKLDEMSVFEIAKGGLAETDLSLGNHPPIYIESQIDWGEDRDYITAYLNNFENTSFIWAMDEIFRYNRSSALRFLQSQNIGVISTIQSAIDSQQLNEADFAYLAIKAAVNNVVLTRLYGANKKYFQANTVVKGLLLRCANHLDADFDQIWQSICHIYSSLASIPRKDPNGAVSIMEAKTKQTAIPFIGLDKSLFPVLAKIDIEDQCHFWKMPKSANSVSFN